MQRVERAKGAAWRDMGSQIANGGSRFPHLAPIPQGFEFTPRIREARFGHAGLLSQLEQGPARLDQREPGRDQHRRGGDTSLHLWSRPALDDGTQGDGRCLAVSLNTVQSNSTRRR